VSRTRPRTTGSPPSRARWRSSDPLSASTASSNSSLPDRSTASGLASDEKTARSACTSLDRLRPRSGRHPPWCSTARASPSTSAVRMSSVDALEPLRQIAGAVAARWARTSRWSSVRTGRQRAQRNGPSWTTSGTMRAAPTTRTAKPVRRANHASDGDRSPPVGVSDSQTAAPKASSSTAGTVRAPPLGSSSWIRPSSPYEIGESCQPPPPHRRHRGCPTGCGRTRRTATPPTPATHRSSPRRAASPIARCPGRRRAHDRGTSTRLYRGGVMVRLPPGPGPNATARTAVRARPTRSPK
jgi:hypothetical protein